VTTLRGVQFIFKTPEGVNWIMFASEPMNLIFDKVAKSTVSSAALFTGIIRLAHIPNDSRDQKTFDSSTGLRRLIYHAGEYPVGGKVSYEFHAAISSSSPSTSSKKSSSPGSIKDASRRATVSFIFATRNMMATTVTPTSSTSNLLMLALPHHAELLSPSVILNHEGFDLTYRCIKGNMTPVIGATWSYEEPLFDIEFDSPPQTLNAGVRNLILEQLDDDLNGVLPSFTENVYGYGKQVARLAQLAHIASQIENKGGDKGNSTTATHSLLEKATEKLSMYLEAFLSSMVSDSLVFDSNLGGLISTNGLYNTGEDFGNGRYNGKIRVLREGGVSFWPFSLSLFLCVAGSDF
jgi:endoglucanase Acf2